MFEPCTEPTCPFSGPHIHVTGDQYTVVGFTAKPDDTTTTNDTTTTSSGSYPRTTVRWASASTTYSPQLEPTPDPLDDLLRAAGVPTGTPPRGGRTIAAALDDIEHRRNTKGHP